jgi:hypothetical protein
MNWGKKMLRYQAVLPRAPRTRKTIFVLFSLFDAELLGGAVNGGVETSARVLRAGVLDGAAPL